MPQVPLSPLAARTLKGVVAGQAQKLLDAQVARAIGPLLARMAALERRVAELEGRAKPAPGRRPDRSRDI